MNTRTQVEMSLMEAKPIIFPRMIDLLVYAVVPVLRQADFTSRSFMLLPSHSGWEVEKPAASDDLPGEFLSSFLTCSVHPARTGFCTTDSRCMRLVAGHL